MPTRRSTLLLALSAAAGLGLAGCSESSSGSASETTTSGTPGLVASTDVWGAVARAVGGDAVTVTSIITDPAADPHSYEANTRTQLTLSKADVVVENGGGYDDFMDTMLSSAKSSATVITAVDLSGHADDEDLNEHVWYDLATVRAVAGAVQKALAEAAPAHADTYAANLATFQTGLDSVQQAIDIARPNTQGRPVAITEPVPGYLLDALGADNRTPEEFSEAVEEESDVPADVLQQTLALFTGHQVRALVYNEQTTGPQTEQVLQAAKDNGVAVVGVTETLPDGVDDYLTWMRSTVNAVAAALQS